MTSPSVWVGVWKEVWKRTRAQVVRDGGAVGPVKFYRALIKNLEEEMDTDADKPTYQQVENYLKYLRFTEPETYGEGTLFGKAMGVWFGDWGDGWDSATENREGQDLVDLWEDLKRRRPDGLGAAAEIVRRIELYLKVCGSDRAAPDAEQVQHKYQWECVLAEQETGKSLDRSRNTRVRTYNDAAWHAFEFATQYLEGQDLVNLWENHPDAEPGYPVADVILANIEFYREELCETPPEWYMCNGSGREYTAPTNVQVWDMYYQKIERHEEEHGVLDKRKRVHRPTRVK